MYQAKVASLCTAASKRKGDGMVAPVDGSNRTRNTLLNYRITNKMTHALSIRFSYSWLVERAMGLL